MALIPVLAARQSAQVVQVLGALAKSLVVVALIVASVILVATAGLGFLGLRRPRERPALSQLTDDQA